MLEVTNAETDMPEDTRSPMERAIAGGYKEPKKASLADRAVALLAAMEHATKHNAPVTLHMLNEMRALLGIEAKPEDDGDGA